MSSFKTLPVFFSLFIITFGSTYTTNIEIRNNCPYTVWAAAVPSGGGRKLNRGETWALNVNPGTEEAHIWARTKCNFDSSGRGTCETGDCGGVLECKSFGQPPNTVAEYMSVKQDVFDISLLNGFNVPMEFSPTSNGCSSGIKCTADIIGQCPKQLKTPVWAVAVPGGGRKLNRGETWTLNVNPGTKQARIWGRTNCNFDGLGRGKCETGDCRGLLECKAFGQPPNTLVECGPNQFGNKDFFDISLVDGFNVPMESSPTSNGCSRGVKCTAYIPFSRIGAEMLIVSLRMIQQVVLGAMKGKTHKFGNNGSLRILVHM
ncbi:hypothetical protein FEM48_Zijuj11G0040100 [Ziziphus jujuba var. spinosa]|uniref:Thaumatin-like protein n=1 Tax=Ziziphus jujuba var. spinosa TaxID=714518 RepID=A0A978UGP8_ZIZJJ|nr:hypothetical protein FEM48_Zijuj11G0040100 [Ziziphus jujuba var. spinosa]